MNDTKNNAKRKECIPTNSGRDGHEKTTTLSATDSSSSSYHADVGILSCGLTEYCMESHTSNLGGFCTALTNNSNGLSHPNNDDESISYIGQENPHRTLQQQDDFASVLPNAVCDPSSSEFFNPADCDCSAFDLSTNEGTIICSELDNFCFALDICGEFFISKTNRDENGSLRQTVSYIYSLDTPYDFDLVYSIDNNQGCNIQVDDTDCLDCQIVDNVLNPNTGLIGNGCYEFDCTNTMAVIRGNDCLGDYVVNAAFASLQPAVPSELPTVSPSRITTTPTTTPSLLPSIIASNDPTQKPTTDFPTWKPSTDPTLPPQHIVSDIPTKVPVMLAPPFSGPTDSPTRAGSQDDNTTLQPTAGMSSMSMNITTLEPSTTAQPTVTLNPTIPSSQTVTPTNEDDDDGGGPDTSSAASLFSSSIPTVPCVLNGEGCNICTNRMATMTICGSVTLFFLLVYPTLI